MIFLEEGKFHGMDVYATQANAGIRKGSLLRRAFEKGLLGHMSEAQFEREIGKAVRSRYLSVTQWSSRITRMRRLAICGRENWFYRHSAGTHFSCIRFPL